MGRCEVCGRKLITGRKYCYLHKGRTGQEQIDAKNRSDAVGSLYIWIVGIIVAVIALYLVHILLVFLIASFILPIVCGIILFFKIRKIRNMGIRSLTKKETVVFSISAALFLYSVYWWMYFWINGKTLV